MGTGLTNTSTIITAYEERLKTSIPVKETIKDLECYIDRIENKPKTQYSVQLERELRTYLYSLKRRFRRSSI